MSSAAHRPTSARHAAMTQHPTSLAYGKTIALFHSGYGGTESKRKDERNKKNLPKNDAADFETENQQHRKCAPDRRQNMNNNNCRHTKSSDSSFSVFLYVRLEFSLLFFSRAATGKFFKKRNKHNTHEKKRGGQGMFVCLESACRVSSGESL